MVRFLDTTPNYDDTRKTVIGTIFADTKEDIDEHLAEKLKIKAGYTVDWGTRVITADSEIGWLKSNGQWVWS